MLRTILPARCGLLLLILAACDSDQQNANPARDVVSQRDAVHAAAGVSNACAEAFAAAAAVSPYEDTHSDLFPAYSACNTMEEWKAASERFPDAIDIADPVGYAMTVCASNQQELGETPICRAVNEPSPSADVSLSPSGRSGLLGAPLPDGAELIDSTPGDASARRDPSERYSVSATASEIAAFYDREMRNAGWMKDGTSTANALFFQKGPQMIGVLINSDGGTFTLMGS